MNPRCGATVNSNSLAAAPYDGWMLWRTRRSPAGFIKPSSHPPPSDDRPAPVFRVSHFLATAGGLPKEMAKRVDDVLLGI
jgi:hypothetical protein